MKTAFAVIGALVAVNASAGLFGECDYKEERTVATPAAGISKVVIIGKAGWLKVKGRVGAGEIRANGTACSSDRDYLKSIQLKSYREGSTLHVEADMPEHMTFGFFDASLDFEVALPAGMPVSVRDGSGSLEISDTGTLEVVDGSGSMEIGSVRGDVSVSDGSGSMTIQDVSGTVRVTDGSGSIEIRRVGNVMIEADGSGSIEATDVRGDFIVRRDGSGGIDYERVGGKVSIPRDDDD
jgi:hypothetical protein